ncbi:MAG: hypothetical protein BWK76_11720 [Desulfobulbaceae bacterium A2]|nr:MAG: hypothetical protein BWK76_11720 [Desulfobulbaceae bacterium A2]
MSLLLEHGPGGEASRSSADRYWLLAAMASLLLKLWLVGAHDLMMTITPHDDLLFVNLAAHLLNGEWLGPYNQLTLIKGSFYSIFMAMAYWLNIPLLTAQQLLQAGACAVFTLALRPVIQRPWLLFLFFLLLLFQPFSYNYPAVGRVLQLGIYPPLGLLVFGLALGLALRTAVPWRRQWGWALSLGLATGVFWITRDESVWIVPSLGLLVLWSLWHAVVHGRSWWRAAAPYLPALAGWSGVLLLVCGLNFVHYGVFVRNELESAEFKSAYGGLLRIRSADDRRYYPVVRAARQQAYAVSPSMREIESHLDGDIGARWQELCSQADMSGDTVRGGTACPDLPAAFFIWAFRDAVTTAGHHRDALETLAFYRRIGEEIDRACEAGQIDCRPRATSLVPPWRSEYTAAVWPIFWRLLRQTVALVPFAATTEGWLGRGDTRQAMLFEAVTGERLLTTRRDVQRYVPAFHQHLNREKTRILEDIGHGYQRVVPPLFWLVLGLCPALTLWDLRRRRLAPLTLCNWAILGGLAAVTAVMTLVQLTSYASVGRVMHTSYQLVPLFVLVGLLDGAGRIFRLDRQ